jgi:alpha-beta hydrolase superfamily lysophospholipase
MVEPSTPDSAAGRLVTGLTIGVAGAAALASVAAAALTVHVARSVVTPPRTRDEDIRILGFTGDTVTLSRTLDTLTPGQYSLWFDQDGGHARVGEIVSMDVNSVTREVIAVDFGDLGLARRARFSGWFYLGPRELGFEFENVVIDTPLGAAPAWLIPAEQETGRWVIQVHGRAVRRPETLRAIPVFREAGYTSLVVSYRNDGEAPRSVDNRYGLGDSEWQDVDAAIAFAIDHGATDVVLMGWSMGGATVLQAATRSSHSSAIRGVVLDSPVVDWVGVLEFQGTSLKLPRVIRRGALELISRKWGSRLTGQAEPIDLRRLDWVARADELDVPILLLHSVDDGYVPADGSSALAEARPDIVRYEEFVTARHTKLWNYDAPRWNAAIENWLQSLPIARTGRSNHP